MSATIYVVVGISWSTEIDILLSNFAIVNVVSCLGKVADL